MLHKWNDPKLRAGTMIRTALWLMTEVGVGNTFTKEQHRQAFAGVTQADRRLRDLRPFGWDIRTSTEDLTLRPDEQRFVAAGKPVWDRRIRKSSAAGRITARQRDATFAESSYQCSVCGIAGGENYPGVSQGTAVLSVFRREITGLTGENRSLLVAECGRCHAGESKGEAQDLPTLLAAIRKLDDKDQATLINWMEAGRRTVLERLWSSCRRLPLEARIELREGLLKK
jgi:hypothetical protein